MKYELITISEAARRLGVSRPTVYARIAERLLPSRRVGGRLFVAWRTEEVPSEVRS